MFLPYTQNNNNKKGHEEMFGGDGYVYGIDCSDGLQVYS